ncbi:hypothetical protein [Streptomyces sporangiiformans]|uniref:Uncharacterized protein n=1 Tax=Streptomyces sporangiiformans TaxID=2315329 RepID=A0A505DIE0_9ACTN|nr:hypothetical protein [Streptomyces sporangiiformans]TPQ22652.1 hypothetical protein FGD71_008170 [Streptomyces sporangiiformans]
MTHAVLPQAKAAELVTHVGVGPCGWAVELGQALARRHIAEEVPYLTVDEVVQELHKECEAVALGAVAALHDEQDFVVAEVAEVLLGPAEVVSRGVGVEHTLRAIHIGHAFANGELWDVCERPLGGERRFAEIRRAAELMLGIVDDLSAAMAREFGQVQGSSKALLSSSSPSAGSGPVHRLPVEFGAFLGIAVLGHRRSGHHGGDGGELHPRPPNPGPCPLPEQPRRTGPGQARSGRG